MHPHGLENGEEAEAPGGIARFLAGEKSAVPGDQFEVLLVQRSRTKFATSTWVFPGGVYDIADGNGVHDGLSFSTDVGILRKICLREAFEETGLLPLSEETANSAVRDKQSWKTWRDRVHEDASKWEDFKLEHFGNQQGIFSKVDPICCFLTPELEAARSGRQYLTHFFLCTVATRNDCEVESLPPWEIVDVDDNETVNAEWISPLEAISRSKAGTMVMFPPQFYILQRLSAFDSVAEAAKSSSWFCSGSGEHDPSKLGIVMQPEGVPGNRAAFCLPYDEAHRSFPGPKGALHRIEVYAPKADMRLLMNDESAPYIVGKEGLHKWKWKEIVSSKM